MSLTSYYRMKDGFVLLISWGDWGPCRSRCSEAPLLEAASNVSNSRILFDTTALPEEACCRSLLSSSPQIRSIGILRLLLKDMSYGIILELPRRSRGLKAV